MSFKVFLSFMESEETYYRAFSSICIGCLCRRFLHSGFGLNAFKFTFGPLVGWYCFNHAYYIVIVKIFLTEHI